MASPTFAQLRSQASVAGSLTAENTLERILTALAMLASGQNPDGTTATAAGAGGGLPTAASPLNTSSTNAAAANNQTLTGAAGVFTWLTGFEVTGLGATAASTIAITVTGLQGGTATYYLTIPAGATTAVTPLIVQYATPLRSSAVNTNIVVNVPSFGVGNTTAAVAAHGYTL